MTVYLWFEKFVSLTWILKLDQSSIVFWKIGIVDLQVLNLVHQMEVTLFLGVCSRAVNTQFILSFSAALHFLSVNHYFHYLIITCLCISFYLVMNCVSTLSQFLKVHEKRVSKIKILRSLFINDSLVVMYIGHGSECVK